MTMPAMARQGRVAGLLAGLLTACASAPPPESAEAFLATPGVRPLGPPEIESRVAGRVMVVPGSPPRRLLHERAIIVDLNRPSGAPFSRGSWSFDPAGRYCQHFIPMDSSGASAGACYRVYQRGEQTALVARGASGRLHLYLVTFEAPPTS